MAYFKTIADRSGSFFCEVNRSGEDIFECKKKSNVSDADINDEEEEEEGEGEGKG